MDLAHRFAVPTPVEETWAHFQDIASVAECFPGAQVTSAEGTRSAGRCKVKLGPIALVYNGSGTFVEKDETAHRFVVDAKGKDKRGNGTAGAKVTLTMAPRTAGTDVEVLTDLAVTGKPAQFGRGVMQDVSDKLLGQFVACLEQRLGSDAGIVRDEMAVENTVSTTETSRTIPPQAQAAPEEPTADRAVPPRRPGRSRLPPRRRAASEPAPPDPAPAPVRDAGAGLRRPRPRRPTTPSTSAPRCCGRRGETVPHRRIVAWNRFRNRGQIRQCRGALRRRHTERA